MLTDLVRGGALTGDLNMRFLNTNNANLTNILHADFYLLIAHGSHSFIRTRISIF